MFAQKRVLADGNPVSIASLFGNMSQRFKEVVVASTTTNSDIIYAGTQAQQPIEIPVGAVGFNFGNTALDEIYVKGTATDIVVLVGVE